ncbi:MAG: class I SAM-dependent methyltransferase [Proteobacteria bacterium]|nr:class I SAM-dependent methyltransferase [Pseudomonadota bacterium]
MREIAIEDGRSAFGADAANYDSARPEYPAQVYAILRERCGLKAGTQAFEIGPGTGLATRRLLEAGAAVTAIEPDMRLVTKLRENAGDPPLRIVNATFETAALQQGAFDLGVSATAFHWMDQQAALAKVATLLKPGGWWAAWWNVFGDPERDDPFHDATAHLFQASASPSYSPLFKHPFALRSEGRIADLQSAGSFEEIGFDLMHWTLVLTAGQTRALYASFSNVTTLPENERIELLDGIQNIAAAAFKDRVERQMCTPLYTARRR